MKLSPLPKPIQVMTIGDGIASFNVEAGEIIRSFDRLIDINDALFRIYVQKLEAAATMEALSR